MTFAQDQMTSEYRPVHHSIESVIVVSIIMIFCGFGVLPVVL